MNFKFGTVFDDVIVGTSDDDVIDGSFGDDTLLGDAGDDTLFGGWGSDLLLGGLDNDVLAGGFENDFLFGEDGNDILIGGFGADFLDGGEGSDTVSYGDSNSGVWVALEGIVGSGGTAEGDHLIGIENLSGSAYDDTLVGDKYDNTLTGLQGNDTLIGGGGQDFLVGGTGDDKLWGDQGDDILKGGSGADQLWGSEGIDTADYSDSSESIFVSLYYGNGYSGDAAGDSLLEIENVIGGLNDDIIWGDDVHDNVLIGWSGNDTLQGLDGADELWGGDGVDTASYELSGAGVFVMLADNKGYWGDAEGDTLYLIENVTGSQHTDTLLGDDGANVLDGMAGDDYLWGDDEDDTLIGGLGQDYMYGEDGADIFKFSSEKELGTDMATADYLGDFNELAGDKIDLSGIDADPGSREPDAFKFIGTNDFTGVGQVRYYNDGGEYGYVELNTTGDLAPDFYIEVSTEFTSMMSDNGFILLV
jgi:Ca2+-binding RTX toxin-like protein